MPVLGFKDELTTAWQSMRSHLVHGTGNAGVDHNVPVRDFHKSAQRTEDILRNRTYIGASDFARLEKDFNTLIASGQISAMEVRFFQQGGDLHRFLKGYLGRSAGAKVGMVFEKGGTKPPKVGAVMDGGKNNKWLPAGAPLKRIEIHDQTTGRWTDIWTR